MYGNCMCPAKRTDAVSWWILNRFHDEIREPLGRLMDFYGLVNDAPNTLHNKAMIQALAESMLVSDLGDWGHEDIYVEVLLPSASKSTVSSCIIKYLTKGDYGQCLLELFFSNTATKEKLLMAEVAPIEKVAKNIITNAIESSVMEFYIIPNTTNASVWYKCKDKLFEQFSFPGYIHQPLVEKLKELSSRGSGLGAFYHIVDGKRYKLTFTFFQGETGEQVNCKIRV